MVIVPTQEQAEWKGKALEKKQRGNTMRMNSGGPILWCNPSVLKRGEF